MTSRDRVRLVPLSEAHLAATLQWVNDPPMMRLLGRTHRVDAAEHQQWFDALQDRASCRYFAAETTDSGRHVGNVWLWDIDQYNRKAEVRILFGDDASRGRGYGSEAIDLLARDAFDTLRLQRLYAYVFTTNPRAKRAFEKAGFELEGLLRRDRTIDGEYVDVYLLARLSDGWRAPAAD